MMRRFSAMPLLRASFRCASRSVTSGVVGPRRDFRRAASSLAAVSRAPSSSCSSRARRLRSSSRTVCRCWASSLSCAVRAATSTSRRSRSACDHVLLLAALAVERRGLAQVHEQREQAERRHRRDAEAVQQQRLVDALAVLRDLRRLERQQVVSTGCGSCPSSPCRCWSASARASYPDCPARRAAGSSTSRKASRRLASRPDR